MEAFDTQINNLYSEDDFLRRAAGKNFRAKGFDRKANNKIFNEKAGSNFSDSAIGHVLPAGYYNLDDSFSGGGALPPGGDGNYYQAGKPKQPAQQQKPVYTNIFSHMIKGLYDATLGGLKEGIYDAYVRWPLITRDKLMTKANEMGRISNLLSSLYAMGADCGPLQRVVDDWQDMLELYTDQNDNLLAIRTYNPRKENNLLKWLRKGKENIIPRYGKSVQNVNEIVFTHDGLIKGFVPEVGGVKLSVGSVKYDEFYEDSDTEYWVTHGESRTSSTGKFKENMVNFALSHYIYHYGKANVKHLDEHKETGTKVNVITLPRGYGIHQWDRDLALKTYGTAIGIYITHFLYAAAEKGYEKAGRKEQAKKIEQSEVDRMFIPDKLPVPAFGY